MRKRRLYSLLVLLMIAVTGVWAQDPEPTTYKVTMKEGTTDADKWTISPNEGLKEGDPVTLKYSGRLKVKSVTAAKAIDPALLVPLTMEALTVGSIRVTSPKEGMQYSKNGGAKTTVTTDPIEVAIGDKVAFYGNGTNITSYYGTRIAGGTAEVKVYGNIMSLVDEENFAMATKLTATNSLRALFQNYTKLTDASGLLLPATTLATYCYSNMFQGCTVLTAAPALPATQLAAHCYRQMFSSCSALTAAPELPAPTLVERCYYQMFLSCSKLATVTCLATSGIGQSNSTTNWLNGAGSQVQDTKTFNAVSTANWSPGNSGIPTSWTRVNVDN